MLYILYILYIEKRVISARVARFSESECVIQTEIHAHFSPKRA